MQTLVAMTDHGPYFWDSCILVSYLKEETSLDLSVVKDYLNQTSEGKCQIFISTLSRVEITPNLDPRPSTQVEIDDIWKEIEGSVTVVSQNPDIMRYAAMLRCVPYSKTGGGRNLGRRNLGIGDSVLLATALWLQDMGEDLKCFHTNDKGKSKNPYGSRDVPLIGYKEWVAEPLESLEDGLKSVVERICALPMIQPQPLTLSRSLNFVQTDLLDPDAILPTDNTTFAPDGEAHDEDGSQRVTNPAEEGNQDAETQIQVPNQSASSRSSAIPVVLPIGNKPLKLPHDAEIDASLPHSD
jgi:hypothetical protein